MSYSNQQKGFPISLQMPSHALNGLTCPDDKPPMFGPLVFGKCLPLGTFGHPYHRKYPSTGLLTNCGTKCNTQQGCMCNLLHLPPHQKEASLPMLYHPYHTDSTIFVD